MTTKSSVNVNSVLLAIVVAISGWTLKTVHEVSVQMASANERLIYHAELLRDLNRWRTAQEEEGRRRARVPGQE